MTREDATAAYRDAVADAAQSDETAPHTADQAARWGVSTLCGMVGRPGSETLQPADTLAALTALVRRSEAVRGMLAHRALLDGVPVDAVRRAAGVATRAELDNLWHGYARHHAPRDEYRDVADRLDAADGFAPGVRRAPDRARSADEWHRIMADEAARGWSGWTGER